MKTITSILLLLLVLPAFSQILTVEITGIKTEKGLIQLTVYTNKKSFDDEIPIRVYNFEKIGICNGNLNLTINDLEPGTYGIAMIDDENSNHKLDYKLLVPSEGFGFSNFPFKERRKPAFDSFAFQFNQQNTTIKFEVFYFKK